MTATLSAAGVETAAARTVRVTRAEVTAHPSLVESLASLVRTHGSLYDWASAAPQARALRGRAPVYVATVPDGPTVVVRHAWHGGLLAPITGDLFRRPTRAPLEFARSAALRALGIPTTDVLGYVVYDAPFGLARVDVVSAYVPDTADLGMILAGLAPAVDCDAALDATLVLLERLAQHGVVHPDLNVKNILVRTAGSHEAMVIDIDVTQIGATPTEAMQRNVARLARSLRKWNRQFECDVAETRIVAFAEQALARTPRAA